jgi:hypothetical protein
VDGRALFSEGRVHTVDEKTLYGEARERAAAIVRRAGLSHAHTPTVTNTYD